METSDPDNRPPPELSEGEQHTEYQEHSQALERARELPGVQEARYVSAEEEDGGDVELLFESGERLIVESNAIIQGRHMNDHTLINTLKTKYGS